MSFSWQFVGGNRACYFVFTSWQKRESVALFCVESSFCTSRVTTRIERMIHRRKLIEKSTVNPKSQEEDDDFKHSHSRDPLFFEVSLVTVK